MELARPLLSSKDNRTLSEYLDNEIVRCISCNIVIIRLLISSSFIKLSYESPMLAFFIAPVTICRVLFKRLCGDGKETLRDGEPIKLINWPLPPLFLLRMLFFGFYTILNGSFGWLGGFADLLFCQRF